MKKSVLIATSMAFYLSANVATAAMDHGNHGRRGGSTSAACKTQGVSQKKPAHLADVLPQSEFSFWVKGIKDPEKVEVTVKDIPVVMEAEDKTNFYLFKGKLPKELVGTVARIHIKVLSKKCPSEIGWLVKIGE